MHTRACMHALACMHTHMSLYIHLGKFVARIIEFLGGAADSEGAAKSQEETKAQVRDAWMHGWMHVRMYVCT